MHCIVFNLKGNFTMIFSANLKVSTHKNMTIKNPNVNIFFHPELSIIFVFTDDVSPGKKKLCLYKLIIKYSIALAILYKNWNTVSFAHDKLIPIVEMSKFIKYDICNIKYICNKIYICNNLSHAFQMFQTSQTSQMSLMSHIHFRQSSHPTTETR